MNLPHEPKCNVTRVMSSCLRMPLKTKWFEMTKVGIKTEDYREITPYWCSRLLLWNGFKVSQKHWYRRLEDFYCKTDIECLQEHFKNKDADFVKFDINTITLGYPKTTDKDKILEIEHKGIKIGTGNPEWGAEPYKIYFVIMHGSILT